MIAGMEPETTYSQRTIIFQIPVYLIILNFIHEVIDLFGLLISTEAPFGTPYAPDMDGGSSFQQIPE
ncbi:hypothetical protein A2U01_0101951, partial [Trifolium medium]|nr:hypothetical protein [Trifolium medium]